VAARNQLLFMAAQNAAVIKRGIRAKVRPNGLEDTPNTGGCGLGKSRRLGVPITSIHDTISAAFAARM